jgi:CAAX prenyl protease-like protein
LKTNSAPRVLSNGALPRCVPFALFIFGMTLGTVFAAGWLVIARGGVAALALAWYWRSYSELKRPARANFSTWLVAIVAGLAVFVAWIHLDLDWMVLGRGGSGFDPRLADGSIDWRYALPRLASLTLVVPVMEELFWRSFLLRWLDHPDFLRADPKRTRWRTFFATAAVFGAEHHQWLAGFLAGMVYNGLYMRSRNLWVPIVAHAVTNGVLGLWILSTGNWQFW